MQNPRSDCPIANRGLTKPRYQVSTCIRMQGRSIYTHGIEKSNLERDSCGQGVPLCEMEIKTASRSPSTKGGVADDFW